MKKNKKADWWEQAVFYLSDNDPIMKNIINNHNEDYLQSRDDPFNALCRTIIGQQISVKAAASIWNKFATGTKNINPKNVIKCGNNNIRKCGISNKKVEYIIGLSNFFIKNPDSVNLWKKMDDKSIIKELCQLKGIGPWSAEIFLMFCLLRPDVLPLGDLGLRRAVGKNYLNTFDPTYEEVEKVAKKWIPYRSAATWFLWKSIDPIPVAY
ncbi:MAG TPA: DNA-3-methyladenine glycosylase 2 family protein [Alphaproteobacteria bacterium]|nr:DNA-3-methyladenine glycosylase 2 family protein [Alphaproteobacteria bacterium]